MCSSLILVELLMSIDDGIFVVKATAGDTHLGEF